MSGTFFLGDVLRLNHITQKPIYFYVKKRGAFISESVNWGRGCGVNKIFKGVCIVGLILLGVCIIQTKFSEKKSGDCHKLWQHNQGNYTGNDTYSNNLTKKKKKKKLPAIFLNSQTSLDGAVLMKVGNEAFFDPPFSESTESLCLRGEPTVFFFSLP